MTHRRLPLLLITLTLLTMGLAGCIGTDETLDQQSLVDPKDVYDTSHGWSMPTTPARYDVLPGFKAFVSSFDDTELSIGIFLPEIEGCDWEATELPPECQLPTVMEASPYWLDTVAEESYRPPKAEWLVKRGFALVQMSLRGTGESGGCFAFKNPKDVRDISQVIDHVAEQAWSNGNVGMIGRSYDGTTAWAGAASGNPHLKTIVPISGANNVADLHFPNGTSEFRGPIMQNGYYPFYALGLSASDPGYRMEDWAGTVCEDTITANTVPPVTLATGDTDHPFWEVRDLTDDILVNYTGSAWVIQGMQDWNVNPSQAVPFTKEMRQAGIPTLAWLGQWDHAYPDRVDEHRNVRWDWADKVVSWFTYYLTDEGEQPRLGVEVEDSLYVWRWEESYPPEDVAWQDFEFHGSQISGQTQDTWTSDPLEEDLRVAGLIRLHLETIPTTPTGGHVFAELYDVFPDGRQIRIGWGGINLLHHEGGNKGAEPLTPGQPVIAKMQFEPADAHIGEGHRLHLVIHKQGVADMLESPDPSVVLIGQSTLSLPTIERPNTLSGYAPPGLSGENAERIVRPLEG